MNYQTMVSCDEVFERLTSGPFPTRDARADGEYNHDQRVQRHIDSCHDCRMLAESLRPGLMTIHQALESSSSEPLPAYRSLGESLDSSNRDANSSQAPVVSASLPWMRRGSRVSGGVPSSHWNSFGHVLAMLLVCVGFASFGFLAVEQSRQSKHPDAPSFALIAPLQDGIPSEAGLEYLHSMGVSLTCFAGGVESQIEARPPQPSIEIDSTGPGPDSSTIKSACCTECHTAEVRRSETHYVSASLLAKSCSVCHLGP